MSLRPQFASRDDERRFSRSGAQIEGAKVGGVATNVDVPTYTYVTVWNVFLAALLIATLVVSSITLHNERTASVTDFSRERADLEAAVTALRDSAGSANLAPEEMAAI